MLAAGVIETLERNGVRCAWSERDAQLYALALGLGDDPPDRHRLAFATGGAALAMPTLATVIAWPARLGPEVLGVDYLKVLHGEQGVVWHRPLPAAGALIGATRVTGVEDKGPGAAAVVLMETVLRDPQSWAPVATLTRATFVRGAGGFGGPRGGRPQPPPPQRPPDRSLTIATRPGQALLYRLCGDYNPLHADPEVARAAGFERPILHGLCTFGLACRAVMEAFTGFDPARVVAQQARFTGVVFPGETVVFDLWREEGAVRFAGKVPARGDASVIDGVARLRP